MSWNRNDWQGRSKKQVEDNYKIMDIIYIIAFVSVVSYMIVNAM
jgi:hypothetical protein